jgi:hypothetical protein
MNKKYNTNTARQLCLDNGYNLMSEYFLYHKPIIVVDDIGYIYTVRLYNIINKDNIQFVGKHNSYTIQNIKLWCKINSKPFELVSEIYLSPHANLMWKCLKDGCGEIFPMPWSRASQGYGCGFCHGKQVGISNCLATKNPQIALEWHPTKNGGLTPYNITYGSRKDIWWKCNECGYEWCVKVNSRTSFSTGCPECSESHGEKRIKEILQLNNFYYDKQYTFSDLIGIGGNLLRYDIPIFWDEEKTQLRMLIEFDGKQHYKWVKGWMSEKEFETLQYHDKLKNEYCKNHNIKLLRIRYDEFDNIEQILRNELSFI